MVKTFLAYMESEFRYSVHYSLPLVPILSQLNPVAVPKNLSSGKCLMICNMLVPFRGEELFILHQTPKLDHHFSLPVYYCLFSLIIATFHIWRPSHQSRI